MTPDGEVMEFELSVVDAVEFEGVVNAAQALVEAARSAGYFTSPAFPQLGREILGLSDALDALLGMADEVTEPEWV